MLFHSLVEQAQTLVMPIPARPPLSERSDDLATRISIEFDRDGAAAIFKAAVA